MEKKLPNIKAYMQEKGINFENLKKESLICAIKDNTIGFIEFFPVKSIPVAIRSFAAAVNENDPKNMMRKSPEDFSLWSIVKVIEQKNQCTVEQSIAEIAKANELLQYEE